MGVVGRSRSRNRVIEALAGVWASIGELLGALEGDDWQRASPLPGWSVQDVVAHMIGTEAMLLGEPTPAIEIDRDRAPHVLRDSDVDNERWVESLRSATPVALRGLFEERTALRLVALRGMSDEDWETASFAPVSEFSYEDVMHIRVYDCWIHEQDIRDAVDRPGHEAGLAVDVTLDVIAANLGPAVSPEFLGSHKTVTLALTSEGETARTLHLHLGDSARVVRSLRKPAVATLTMPVGVITRLSAGRVDPSSVRAVIKMDGDTDFAERILNTGSLVT